MEPSDSDSQFATRARAGYVTRLTLLALNDFIGFMNEFDEDFRKDVLEHEFTCLHDYFVKWLDTETAKNILELRDKPAAPKPVALQGFDRAVSFNELRMWVFLAIAGELQRVPDGFDYYVFNERTRQQRRIRRRFDSLFPSADTKSSDYLANAYLKFI